MVSHRREKQVNNRARDNTPYNLNNIFSQRSASEINDVIINRNTSDRSIRTPTRCNIANAHSNTVLNTDYSSENNNRNNNDNIIYVIAHTGTQQVINRMREN